MINEDCFKEAREEAKKALCTRDKCGAVVVHDGVLVGRGYNAPPCDDVSKRKCHLDLHESPKPKSDRTCCLHAEWRAILEAVALGKAKGSTLYFVRVDDNGDVKESHGSPYCTVCSRLALDVGVAYFCLWTKDGWKVYPTEEYNELSYQFHTSLTV